jgi:hypothetical protein
MARAGTKFALTCAVAVALGVLGGPAAADPHPMYLPGHGPARARATGQMEYFGGPVFSKVKVVSVMWGPDVNATVVSDIAGFFAAATKSTWFDILAQYGTNLTGVNGHAGTDQTISRGSFQTQVVITPYNASTTLTDVAIQKELKAQIKNKMLPSATANTVYMVYFPPGFTINLDGSLSCDEFGAYHNGVTYGKAGLFYGVMPDCGYSFGYETVVSSHELAEATTDNFPTPGNDPAYPQAWNNSQGYEIGDLCEGQYATLTTRTTSYSVQQVYSNTAASCTTANYTSP